MFARFAACVLNKGWYTPELQFTVKLNLNDP